MIRISNSGFQGSRLSAFRLGAESAEAVSVLAVSPDSLPPEKVPPMPVSDQEAMEARKTYQLSAGALEGEVAWLEKIRPANWDEIAIEVIKRCKIEYDTLVRSVRGRTGNPEPEYQLELQWWGLWDRAYQAYKNPPSWLTQAQDKVAVFLADFIEGAKEAWKGYSDWAIAHSGPILGTYHDCLKRMETLKADYQQAVTSGNYSMGALLDQELAIGRAEESMNTVRNTYKTLSGGGDIDKIAVEVFGPYSGLGAGWILAVKIAALVAVIGTMIGLAWATVSGVNKIAQGIADAVSSAAEAVADFAKKSPAGFILALGAVGAMFVVPYYWAKKKEQVPVIVTSSQPALEA